LILSYVELEKNFIIGSSAHFYLLFGIAYAWFSLLIPFFPEKQLLEQISRYTPSNTSSSLFIFQF
jgi:hypothetical protein